MSTRENSARPIAVFDSGMGGISVLRELHRLLPHENYIYMGDSLNAPYGTKSKDEVYDLSLKWVEHFVAMDAKAVVIACNTATSASASRLRLLYPDLPIIGLEPALKPAAEACMGTDKHILVMATKLTLKEEKFRLLYDRYKDEVTIHLLPTSGLVELIEAGEIDTPAMESYLEELLAPYIELPVSAVVLGCTHFPFAKNTMRKVLGEQVQFFDGAAGAARQLKRQLEKQGDLAADTESGCVHIENSEGPGDKQELSVRLFTL